MMFFDIIQKQQNSSDCGLFAIANAVAISNGQKPENQSYNIAVMRRHLVECLENKKIRPFPSTARSCRLQVSNRQRTSVYCHCRLPWKVDGKEDLVECESCGEWYHSTCYTISPQAWTDKNFKWLCSRCK